MIKFNILLLLVSLEQCLNNFASSNSLSFTYELTVKPEKGDLFTQVPVSQRESYLRYVSLVYKITFINPSHSKGSFTFYLFVRNSKADNGSYTQLSSIELGYINNKQFVSFFKQHFLGEMLNVTSLDFSTLLEMKEAVRYVRDTLYSAITTETFNKIILSF